MHITVLPPNEKYPNWWRNWGTIIS